jgi:hypothetical protein
MASIIGKRILRLSGRKASGPPTSLEVAAGLAVYAVALISDGTTIVVWTLDVMIVNPALVTWVPGKNPKLIDGHFIDGQFIADQDNLPGVLCSVQSEWKACGRFSLMEAALKFARNERKAWLAKYPRNEKFTEGYGYVGLSSLGSPPYIGPTAPALSPPAIPGGVDFGSTDAEFAARRRHAKLHPTKTTNG